MMITVNLILALTSIITQRSILFTKDFTFLSFLFNIFQITPSNSDRFSIYLFTLIYLHSICVSSYIVISYLSWYICLLFKFSLTSAFLFSHFNRINLFPQLIFTIYQLYINFPFEFRPNELDAIPIFPVSVPPTMFLLGVSHPTRHSGWLFRYDIKCEWHRLSLHLQ
jgi:hypothetical protein